MSVEWYGDEVLAKINAAVEEAVVDCALDLKSESIKQAPIDLGDLRGNCSVAFEDKVISPAVKGESLNPPNEENTGIIGYTLNYAKNSMKNWIIITLKVVRLNISKTH
jgi:hypothetical protein